MTKITELAPGLGHASEVKVGLGNNYDWAQRPLVSLAQKLWFRSQHHPVLSGAGYLSLSEFRNLNCGLYHDCQHAVDVAELTHELAIGLKKGSERAHFLRQVAFLHDADPRVCQETGLILRGTPARVQVTLEWMEQERDRLIRQFDWYDRQFDEAKALIARTDYPFDREGRQHGTRFDGLSPVELHRQLLTELPRTRQAQVLEEGLLLRFADQISAYVEDFGRAAQSIHNLYSEFQQRGDSVNFKQLWQRTPEYLESIGKDLEPDRDLRANLGLSEARLFNRSELIRALPWQKRYNFKWNQRRFSPQK